MNITAGNIRMYLVETEPILLAYFINLLETPLNDGTQYTASEQRDVLFVVKTVMLALQQAAKRRISVHAFPEQK